MITDQTGIKGAVVEVVVDGYKNQIRNLSGYDSKTELIKILPFIAEQYGGRKDIPPHVQAECIKLILEKFLFIGIQEIKEAYRMWASGEIEVKGGEMFGGVFNAAQLGKILSAYCIQRKKVIAQYSNLKIEEERKVEDELRRQRMKDKYEAQFFDLIIEAKTKYSDYRDLPLHWYDTLLKKGLIREYYEMEEDEFNTCFQRAKIDLSEERQESKNLFKKALEQQGIEKLRGRAIIYAQKKLLFDFIQEYEG